MYKILLGFVFLSSLGFAQMAPESLERELELFQKNCFDESGNIKEYAYIDQNFTSCLNQAKFFQNEIVLYEDNYLRDELNTKGDCTDVDSEDPVRDLASVVGDVTEKVKCSNQEKLDAEKTCGKAWSCNMYRSMLEVTDNLPDFISDSFQDFAKSSVKRNNYGPECLNSSKSNCVEELVTSFMGSLMTTLTSVWDLVKTGASSLWGGITGWFDQKSDALHASAVQKAEDVEGFLDNPAKWFSDFMGNIKNSVNVWITETVFCQEWEGTAHFSKCKVPLESMDCIDCDSKMNATCAAIGALTSEFGMMVLTAGAGNIAGITAKVGSSTMRIAAQNAATKIKVVAPAVKNPLKGAGKIKNTAAGQKVAAVAAKAVGLGKLGVDGVAKLKDNVSKMIEMYENSRVVEMATKVADVVTDPLSITNRASQMGVNLSNKVLSKVAKGKVKKRADLGLKVAQRAKTSTRVSEVLKKRDRHAVKKASTKGAVANRLHRRYKPTSSSSSSTTPSTAGRSTSRSTDRYQTTRRGDPDYRGRVERTTPKREDPVQIATNQEHRKNHQNSTDHSSGQGGNHHNKENEDGSSAGVKALGALAIVDVGSKVLGSESDYDSNDDEDEGFGGFRLDDTTSGLRGAGSGKGDIPFGAIGANGANGSTGNGAGNQGSESGISEDISKALNVGTGTSYEEMSQKAEALSEVYSEENRGDIVNRLQSMNPGMSASQANAAFNKRQAEIQAEKDRLASMDGSSNSRGSSTVNPLATSQLDQLKSKKQNLDKLIAELKSDDLSDITAQAQRKSAPTVAPVQQGSRSTGTSSRSRNSSVGNRAPASSSGSGFAVAAGGLGTSDYASYSAPSGLNASHGAAAKSEANAEGTNQVVAPKVEEPTQKEAPQLSMMDMLKLAERDDVDIDTDVKFPWEVKKVEALSDSARKSLGEFQKLVSSQQTAKTKMSYRGEDSHLEVYEFAGGKRYSFLIDVNKNIELIPESRTQDIIQRFVKE